MRNCCSSCTVLHCTKIYEKSHMHTHKMSVKIQDVRNLLTPSKNLKRNKNAQLLGRAKKDGYARFFSLLNSKGFGVRLASPLSLIEPTTHLLRDLCVQYCKEFFCCTDGIISQGRSYVRGCAKNNYYCYSNSRLLHSVCHTSFSHQTLTKILLERYELNSIHFHSV